MLEFSDLEPSQRIPPKPWTKLFLREQIIINMIILNSVVLFMLGFPSLHTVIWLEIIDLVFTVYFILEATVKIYVYGWKSYIKNGWNRFDFLLVIISIPSLFEVAHIFPDISYLLVFRLLRLLRILRFIRFIPDIRKMFEGIQRAFRASIFVFIVLFIYNVLLAVLSSFIFAQYSEEYFGNPLVSLFSIFQIFTVEGWNDITLTLAHSVADNPWMDGFTRIYFTLVVLTGGIFGFSIVNAIFVDEMVRDNNDDLEGKVEELNRKLDYLTKKLESKD